jgi:hypothetical protein
VEYVDLKNHIFIEEQNIKNNILFGRTLNPMRLRTVLIIAGLEFLDNPDSDINLERTIIMPNGCNIDLKTKIKILLARICYSDSNIYIFHNLQAVEEVICDSEYMKLIRNII